MVVIVHMAKMDSLPSPFADILTDDTITKVGYNVAGDCARIKKFFDVDTHPSTCVLRLAKQKMPKPDTGRWDLGDVCDSVLGKKMRKDEVLRTSFVADQATRLSTDQRQYLAVDCAVPLLLYREFSKAPNISDSVAHNVQVAAAAAVASAFSQSSDASDATADDDDDSASVVAAVDAAVDDDSAVAAAAHDDSAPDVSAQEEIEDFFAGLSDEALLDVDLDAISAGANHHDPDAIRETLKEALTAAMHKHGLGSMEEEEGIKISHHQKDTFHALQQLSDAFGTSNSWSPLFIKCVAEVLLVDDPNCKRNVLQYLQSQHEKRGVSTVAAKLEASKQYHSYVRKNPKYVKRAPMTPEETYAKLKQIERVFAGAQCTKKKGAPRPLFNALGRKAWKALLELVLASRA
jgi:hypothetical protein